MNGWMNSWMGGCIDGWISWAISSLHLFSQLLLLWAAIYLATCALTCLRASSFPVHFLPTSSSKVPRSRSFLKNWGANRALATALRTFVDNFLRSRPTPAETKNLLRRPQEPLSPETRCSPRTRTQSCKTLLWNRLFNSLVLSSAVTVPV